MVTEIGLKLFYFFLSTQVSFEWKCSLEKKIFVKQFNNRVQHILSNIVLLWFREKVEFLWDNYLGLSNEK